MKTTLLISFLLALSLHTYGQNAATDSIPPKKYVEISARNISFDAVGSYPQELLKVICDEDTIKTVLISTFNEYDEPDRASRMKTAPYEPDRKYTPEINRFTEPTEYVNSESETTAAIADTIFDGTECNCLDVINKALAFSRRVKFDSQLAEQLDAGKSLTVPSDTVVKTMTGTCSEATNVFLALVRHMNIPARMVVGFWAIPDTEKSGSHAWAECYVEGVGWWAVDPQNGYPAMPFYAYKLFTGADFKDCQIHTLPDMYLRGDKSVLITVKSDINND